MERSSPPDETVCGVPPEPSARAGPPPVGHNPRMAGERHTGRHAGAIVVTVPELPRYVKAQPVTYVTFGRSSTPAAFAAWCPMSTSIGTDYPVGGPPALALIPTSVPSVAAR